MSEPEAALARRRSKSTEVVTANFDTLTAALDVNDDEDGEKESTKGVSLALNETSLGCFLMGTLQKDCTLTILRGQTELLKIIWTLVCSERLANCIYTFSDKIPYIRDLQEGAGGGAPAVICQRGVELPGEEEGLNVNMLPFLLKDADESLPPHLKKYSDIIDTCLQHMKICDFDDVAYLTVDTRPVAEEGTSQPQRRGGVHVEAPALFEELPHSIPGSRFGWGEGTMNCQLEGGIFMMSDVDNSTAVYSQTIHDPYGKGSVIGPHGDLKRMEGLLGEPTMVLSAGDLVWMTDRTPHESLPLPAGTKRHYFRLVCPAISGWFKDHSTSNPDIAIPDGIPIIEGSKFELVDKAYSFGDRTALWQSATDEEIAIAEKKKEVYMWLKRYELAHLHTNLMKLGLISLTHLKNHRHVDEDTYVCDAMEDNTFLSLYEGCNVHPHEMPPEFYKLTGALEYSKETRSPAGYKMY